MTVQEFYDFCKKRKLTDAEMEIGLKFSVVKVNEMNIDYCECKCFPYKPGKKVVMIRV